MSGYQDFVAGVAERAALPDTAHARAAAEAVLATVGLRLNPQQRRELGAALPAALREAIEVPGRPEPELTEPRDVVVEVSARLQAPAERARYLAQAVLSELCAADPDVGGRLAGRLGPRFAELFDAPGGGPPPDRAASATDAGPPIQLTPEQTAAALRGLRNWSGDDRGIARTVELPGDRIGPLVARVQREAAAHNHPVHVERHDGTVTFILCTRGSGDVTNLDVELAERIDAVVSEFGSGG